MKLYYYCNSCDKENSFTTKAKDRYGLQKERGNFINERCKKCGTIVKRRINMVFAKPNKWLLFIGTIVCVAITIYGITSILSASFGFMVGFFSLACSIPFLAWQEANRRARDFNKELVPDD